jgi:hypothetical protein
MLSNSDAEDKIELNGPIGNTLADTNVNTNTITFHKPQFSHPSLILHFGWK